LSTLKRSDYLFIGDYTYSKGHDILLDAWEKLHKMVRNPILHLTVTRKPGTIPFCDKMDNLINNKVNIINHGFMPYNEACKLYAISKAVVYPSLLESLGLGLVEGISAGCDVITANLPYAHSICKPSETFNPTDSDSIVNAILRYEEGNSPKSELTIHDCVNELLNLICSKL
jgi:glycosyltransferase involved in cell wall biosynthesis